MTKSGIVLPDTAKEKPQEGEILAVGPGKVLDDGSREAIDVSVGQKVLYAKYAGTEFKVEDRGAPDRQPEGHPRDRRGLTSNRVRHPTHSYIPEGLPVGQADHLRRDRSSLPEAGHRPPRRRGPGDDRPQGPQRRPRQEVRFPHDHQRRRHDRSRHRARGPVREHGRAAPQGGRDQDRRRRRRRHHHRGGPGPGDGRRGPAGRHRRREPDGRQARHRDGPSRRSSPTSRRPPAPSRPASRSRPSRRSPLRIPRSARSSPR